MSYKRSFDIHNHKGKPCRIRDWMSRNRITAGMLFFIIGIFSTIWFLIRVIPKPSRATYPCMRVAAPFMSGLIVYLLAVGGLTFVSRMSKLKIINVRYLSAILLLSGVLVTLAITPSGNLIDIDQDISVKRGPDDGPNQPFGTAMGINPGRVIWDWDTLATNRNCAGYYFKSENTSQKVVSKMLDESVIKLTGESTVRKSWDAMFRYFNKKKHQADRGYTSGEKIFIKINQTSGRGRLKLPEREKGNFYYPVSREKQPDGKRSPDLGTCETSPYLVLQILRQLVNECGIDQSAIAVGDPQNPTFGHNYDAWAAEFPDVEYTDRTSGNFGRTLIHPTRSDLLFYSDKFQTDKLYDIIENAEYMINIANLKPHSGTGITLTAKNHFGSQSRAGAYHLHYSHLSQIEGKPPSNAGYHKYRVLVDLMGSRYLGQNTLLYVIDGLYAGGASEGGPPVRYYMAPFNGSWSNSIFISQDQVALESVCYDFLRTEWNGTYSHDPSNNYFETMPDIYGVDDYLHQAADSVNWPKGIHYDPDKSGTPISSLGVHEHWNNHVNKQYSRNLDKPYGIELVSIPSNIVGPQAPAMISAAIRPKQDMAVTVKPVKNGTAAGIERGNEYLGGPRINSVVKRSFSKGFRAKRYYAAVLGDDNGKWFLTDTGIVSTYLFSISDHMNFSVVSGSLFDIMNKKSITAPGDLRNFVYELSDNGPSLWISTPRGAVKALLPEDSGIADAVIYNTSNSGILSDNVLSSVVGRGHLCWFGTDRGISALNDTNWLTPAYQELYPESLFKDYPITAMAASAYGDSLYVATEGAGVSRVYRNEVDAISGASSYLQWGPIEIPSDSVYSLCISRDGTQWIGTNKGAARHTGSNTLENWTVFNTGNGLADNFVQAIAAEPYGKNVWFGTRGGVSVFDGKGLTTFTTKDGLISNNILAIMIDKNGIVYIGTDMGIMVYTDGQLVCYTE